MAQLLRNAASARCVHTGSRSCVPVRVTLNSAVRSSTKPLGPRAAVTALSGRRNVQVLS